MTAANEARNGQDGRRGVVEGFEDLADPTPCTVQFLAEGLSKRLAARRTDAGQSLDPAAFRADLDQALEGLRGLVARLGAGAVPDAAMLDVVETVAVAVDSAHARTVNRLSFVMAGDQFAGWELVRTAHAVHEGRCTLGQRQLQPCSPGPERVRMRVEDLFGGHLADQACVRHAGEEWARWDHREVDIVIIGPATAAAAVRRLGADLQASRYSELDREGGPQ